MRRSVFVKAICFGLLAIIALLIWRVVTFPRRLQKASAIYYTYQYFDENDELKSHTVAINETDMIVLKSMLANAQTYVSFDYQSGFSDQNCLSVSVGGNEYRLLLQYNHPDVFCNASSRITYFLPLDDANTLIQLLKTYWEHDKVLQGG